MEPNSPLNALDQIYSYQNFEVDDADYLEFEKKVYFLERLAEVENGSVIVLDLYKKKYIFIRSKHIEPFDNPLIDHDPQDPFYYSQFIHPDDLPIVMDSYKKTFNFFLNQPAEERKNYKLIQNFRQHDKYGKYLNVILQLVVLELDRKGNIWLALILDDLLPDKISFEGVNRRVINIKSGKICLFQNELELIKKLFCRQEKLRYSVWFPRFCK